MPTTIGAAGDAANPYAGVAVGFYFFFSITTTRSSDAAAAVPPSPRRHRVFSRGNRPDAAGRYANVDGGVSAGTRTRAPAATGLLRDRECDTTAAAAAAVMSDDNNKQFFSNFTAAARVAGRRAALRCVCSTCSDYARPLRRRHGCALACA